MSIVNNTNLAIPLICQNDEFYVDIYSNSLIELGTRAHPYKSIKAAFIELLNYHSNTDKSVAIYIKDNQRHYLEDDKNFIMNITNVTITTYSDQQVIVSPAKLIPTQIPQSIENKRTAFSLLTDTDIRLSEVIAEGNYTESEVSSLSTSQVTLFCVRSNTYIDNIDIEREIIDYGKATTFFLLIYLQDKTIQMTNVNVNVTGNFGDVTDPFNGLFENITIDTYGLQSGFETNSIN